MKYTYNRGVEKAFALPTVMIASIVMLMVLLSGLVAASSVNVSLREQVSLKQVSLTNDAGMVMADACMKANNFEITWSDSSPLRPNTNCYGEDLSTCLVGTTSAPCYLTVAAANNSRSFFDVLATPGGDGTISSEATTQNIRPSNSSVVSETKNSRLGSVGYTQRVNVSAAGSSTCAISGERKVYCWGANDNGQVGNGVTSSSVTTPSEVYIPPGLVAMQSVATGFYHSCAVSMAGKAYCWGSNSTKQLGNASTGPSSNYAVAVDAGQVPAGVKLSSIVVGYNHSCAIGSNKRIYCWGDNTSGQLGIGSTGSNYVAPQAVALGEMPAGVYPTSISAAYRHTCVTGSDLKAYCWGRNNEGQIGNGTTNTAGLANTPRRASPGAMGATIGVVTITVGAYHTCAVGTDGASYCWGQNGSYQLGTGGTSTSPSLVPIKTVQGEVPANVKLTQIASYLQHTCALGSNSLVYCWGDNSFTQLGNGGTASSSQPVRASVSSANGEEITGLSVGDYHTCLNSSDGKIYCWGYNASGALGRGNTTSPGGPAQVATSTAELGYNASTKIAVGSYHTCAIGPDEQVYCSGDNATGNQLGTGNTTNYTTPKRIAQGAIPLGARIKNIWAGGYHTCALADNSKVYCWGMNTSGQLGTQNNDATTVPVELRQGFMPNDVKIRSMALGQYSSCAVGSDFRAYCWGLNDQGQVGKGDTSNTNWPTPVSQGSIPQGVNIRALGSGSGSQHVCAVATDAKLYCWGRNDENQLGNGDSTDRTTPFPVAQGTIAANTRMRQVTTGYDHTCALDSNSKAYCWGRNTRGQMGRAAGNTSGNTRPVDVGGGLSFRTITAGIDHTCAIRSGSTPTLYCWGSNSAYQGGNGSNVDRLVPEPVAGGTMPVGPGFFAQTISTGMYSSCVSWTDGRIYCWGYNNSGNLGNGASATNSNTPGPMTQSLRWFKKSTIDSTILQY